eukprot:15366307-Ditylum_brightwellii.AAC.1
MDNQDKLPGGLFESTKQIQIFKHNFKVAMHGRSKWHHILKINITKGVRDILTNFMLIEEDNLKGACIKRTPHEKVATLNKFSALWKSFARHAFEFSKLATMAKTKYTSLNMRSQWDNNSKPSSSKKHSAEDIVALHAELKKKDKIIKSF